VEEVSASLPECALTALSMKRAVVIPTYWTWKRDEKRKGGLIFDHPTPLGDAGTLERCLESLNNLGGEFSLVLIAVPTHSELQDVLQTKIVELLNRLDLHYTVIPVFPSTINKIHGTLGGREIEEILNLDGYSQVRNACILIPAILGFNTFILLDDDEVVLDKEFLERAVACLGETYQGMKVVAKAGVYLQPHGTPFFKGREVWWRFFFNSRKAMNEAFRIIESGERFVDAPFAFGGNMVVTRDVIEHGICFDPNIARGEDIDFLVNVKSEGYSFVLDTDLRILHLPPKSFNPDWLKIRQDARRFLYMRCKLEQFRCMKAKRVVTVSELKPYPGSFLDWTLKPRMFLTNILLFLNYLSKLKICDAKEALVNIILIFKSYRGLVSDYFSFKERWKQVAPLLVENRKLQTIILERSEKPKI